MQTFETMGFKEGDVVVYTGKGHEHLYGRKPHKIVRYICALSIKTGINNPRYYRGNHGTWELAQPKLKGTAIILDQDGVEIDRVDIEYEETVVKSYSYELTKTGE